jgi:protein-S-isoprenylcysteine O-methyltransferase Ste14
VLVIALLIVAIAVFHFRQAKTHLEPWKPTSSIIQQGVYRYSRNPIYLAYCIATLGVGMILNSWWVIGAILPLVYLLQHFVIALEETYLQQKFGDEYLAYQKTVRRWI